MSNRSDMAAGRIEICSEYNAVGFNWIFVGNFSGTRLHYELQSIYLTIRD
ncbi:MAG: hypothetical protein IH840_07870 [Candidatus Heimdallarchaeota archaeon]|nr:hypothetical protein [Candidatus Heimdallarchaeota archaeon]